MTSVFRRFIRKPATFARGVAFVITNLPKGLRGLETRLNEIKSQMHALEGRVTVTDRDMLYATVGRAITSWAQLEEILVLLAALLLKVSAERAGLVMYSTLNFNVWLTLLNDLFEIDAAFTPHQKRWNQISKRIRAVKDKRDQLAHHRVQLLEKGSKLGSERRSAITRSDLDIRRKSKLQVPMTLNEATEFTDTVLAISEDLTAFVKMIEAETAASQEKSL